MVNKWINCKDRLPPKPPKEEDFGVEYEVKYLLPNGSVETMITEWLCEMEWNCTYPVIFWREYRQIIPFPTQHIKR